MDHSTSFGGCGAGRTICHFRQFSGSERDTSLLATYWSESSTSTRCLGRPALRHGSLELSFPCSLISTFLGVKSSTQRAAKGFAGRFGPTFRYFICKNRPMYLRYCLPSTALPGLSIIPICRKPPIYLRYCLPLFCPTGPIDYSPGGYLRSPFEVRCVAGSGRGQAHLNAPS